MSFYIMKNNLQWFQSPRPNSFNFSQAHQHTDPFPDINQLNPHNLSPTPIPSHPQSPFRPSNFLQKTETCSQFQGQSEFYKRDVINDVVVFSEEDDDDELQTPRHQQKDSKNQQLLTTGKKSHTQQSIKTKRSRPKDKGLRGLSLKSFNTILQMKQGTYKQVADKLLESFQEEGSVRPANEETNIKRRVYDALNVLIALGLLKKQGRMIVGQKSQKHKRKEKHAQIEMLRKKIALKQLIMEQKDYKLQETIRKYHGIKNIFEGNKKNMQQIQTKNEFIPFPFIGILTRTSDWKISELKGDQVSIQFKQRVHPLGDIDILKQIQKQNC